jgi:hypothetical protein
LMNRSKRGFDTEEGMSVRFPTEKEDAVLLAEEDGTTKSKPRTAAKQDKLHRKKRESPRQRARQIEEDDITIKDDIAPESAIAKESHLPFKKSGMRCCLRHLPVIIIDDRTSYRTINAAESQAAFRTHFCFLNRSQLLLLTQCEGTGVFLIQKKTLFESEGKQLDGCVWICYMSEVLFYLPSTLNLLYEADLDDIERQEYLGEVCFKNILSCASYYVNKIRS